MKYFEHLQQTLAIDPDAYSAKVSENRASSLMYALAGCLHMLRYAKNVRIQLIATVIVVILGIWLGLDAIAWAILVITIGINIVAEFMNAAIEASVNLTTSEQQPMAQMAKDVAAGAVLVATIVSVIVGLLVLAPPLWEKI